MTGMMQRQLPHALIASTLDLLTLEPGPLILTTSSMTPLPLQERLDINTQEKLSFMTKMEHFWERVQMLLLPSIMSTIINLSVRTAKRSMEVLFVTTQCKSGE